MMVLQKEDNLNLTTQLGVLSFPLLHPVVSMLALTCVCILGMQTRRLVCIQSSASGVSCVEWDGHVGGWACSERRDSAPQPIANSLQSMPDRRQHASSRSLDCNINKKG